MTSLSELRFFVTPAHDCSYLPDKQATTLFADPEVVLNTEDYTALSQAGFRRSGNHLYRPYCENCEACIPTRVPVAQFKPKRRQKRVLKANADLRVSSETPAETDRYYALYETYINARHADGDMYPPTREQFLSFLVDGRKEAAFFEFSLGSELIAVAVADVLNDGISAIYTFFDPKYDKRSLGTFAVIWLIEETKRRGLEHLYLGYWIKDCQKMAYKTDYGPQQIYRNKRWIWHSSD